MKSLKSLEEIPQEGYIIIKEGNVLRMFFGFEKQESNEMDVIVTGKQIGRAHV